MTIAPLIIGFVALVMIVAMTFYINERARRNFEDVNSVRALRAATSELRSALQTAESSQRGYLYTSNEIYLAPYEVAKTQAAKQLKQVLIGLADYPDLIPARERLSDLVARKITELDQTNKLKQQRDDAGALAMVQTNNGKAMMDEANVFFSGITRATDARLLADVGEQQTNASVLRWVSIIGAFVIMGVVTMAGYLFLNYARGLAEAQASVSELNASLEQRVALRTTELAQTNEKLRAARDRAEVLLAEVNHRVANSLTMVSTLVKLQANSLKDKAAKDALAETQDRIYAISLVHRELYTSGDAVSVSLDTYLTGLIKHLETTVQSQNRGIALRYQIAQAFLPVDQTINLGVILNEWVSNAVKYAYPSGEGEISIALTLTESGKAEFKVVDKGVGLKDGKSIGTGFGTKIVRAMATSLSATADYLPGNPGTIARLVFDVNTDPKGLMKHE
ncbi:sensor histidine kinase [Aestuariivirga litoralis]|uniref:sensor histidine kinase n=1 Tax=Aestuariivirga litoralis TaxID=2650924 RepID=UPI0018C7E0E9|nr:CHASE3 domain-containing protein [Aestuariivirga litoralis]